MKNKNWINEGPKWIMKPITNPTNRRQKRAYKKQFSLVFDMICELERLFLLNLEKNNSSYTNSYNCLIENFTNCLEFLNNQNKVDLIIINELFFVEKYKPINR